MKRTNLLLLLLPLVAGAFYLRVLASWRPQLVFDVPPTRPQEAVRGLAFSSDGKTLAVGIAGASEPGGFTRFHSLTALAANSNYTPQWQWGPSASYPEGYKDGRFLSFSRQDSAILLDGNVGLWDAKSGKVLMSLPTIQYGCNTLSPDRKWFASNYDYWLPHDQKSINQRHRNRERTKTIRQIFLYSVRMQKLGSPILTRVKTLSLPFLYIPNTFSFSPTETSFVSPVGDTRGTRLDFYDTSTWKLTRSLTDWKPAPSEKISDPLKDFPGYIFVRWSPNGRFLLSRWFTAWGDVGISLWRVSDGKRISSLQTKFSATTVSTNYEVENDGHVISWGADGNVYQSQGTTLTFGKQPLLSLPKQQITAATLSPDGPPLVVGTAKGAYTLRLK